MGFWKERGLVKMNMRRCIYVFEVIFFFFVVISTDVFSKDLESLLPPDQRHKKDWPRVQRELDATQPVFPPGLSDFMAGMSSFHHFQEDRYIKENPLYQEVQRFKEEQNELAASKDEFLNCLADYRLKKPENYQLCRDELYGDFSSKDLTATYPLIFGKLMEPVSVNSPSSSAVLRSIQGNPTPPRGVYGKYWRRAGREIRTGSFAFPPVVSAFLAGMGEYDSYKREETIKKSPLSQEVQRFKEAHREFSEPIAEFLGYLVDRRLPKPSDCSVSSDTLSSYILVAGIQEEYPLIYFELCRDNFDDFVVPDFAAVPTPVVALPPAASNSSKKRKASMVEGKEKTAVSAAVASCGTYKEQIEVFWRDYKINFRTERGAYLVGAGNALKSLLRGLENGSFESLTLSELDRRCFEIFCECMASKEYSEENKLAYPDLYRVFLENKGSASLTAEGTDSGGSGDEDSDEESEDDSDESDDDSPVPQSPPAKKTARHGCAGKGEATLDAQLISFEGILTIDCKGKDRRALYLEVTRAICFANYQTLSNTYNAEEQLTAYKKIRQILKGRRGLDGLQNKIYSLEVVAYFRGLGATREPSLQSKPSSSGDGTSGGEDGSYFVDPFSSW